MLGQHHGDHRWVRDARDPVLRRPLPRGSRACCAGGADSGERPIGRCTLSSRRTTSTGLLLPGRASISWVSREQSGADPVAAAAGAAWRKEVAVADGRYVVGGEWLARDGTPPPGTYASAPAARCAVRRGASRRRGGAPAPTKRRLAAQSGRARSPAVPSANTTSTAIESSPSRACLRCGRATIPLT